MYKFPVEFSPDDNGTVMATFPDVPEAVSFGDDEADALVHAADALETALAGYIADRRDVPIGSDAAGRPVIILPLLASLKVSAYAAMRARNWRKADLARALFVNPRQIDRLFDLHHATSVEQLEAAFLACGYRADVQARAA
jgi:antitoxin HicB